MGFSVNYIKENFTSHIVKNRNVIEARMYPEERTVTEFIKEQEEFKRSCEKYGVVYFAIDRDYQQDILKVYDYIEMKEKYI